MTYHAFLVIWLGCLAPSTLAAQFASQPALHAVSPLPSVPAPETSVKSLLSEKPSSCSEPATVARPLNGFNVERAYPEKAIRKNIVGRIDLTLKIDQAGQVIDAIVVSATPQGVFEASSVAEAKRMRFVPARLNCAPVASETTINVQFMLEM
jgi:periplasmic protein TonB